MRNNAFKMEGERAVVRLSENFFEPPPPKIFSNFFKHVSVFIENYSARRLKHTMNLVVTFMAHIQKVVVVKCHGVIVNVLRCNLYLVVDDVSYLLMAYLAHASVNCDAVCNERNLAILPCF